MPDPELVLQRYDREIWFNSFYEEKQGIESLGNFCKISTLGEYHALRKKAAPKAIPTICVLYIKHNKNFFPLCAKSCIVVLGNHEDRVWSKCNCYAPVLWRDSLRFLVTIVVSKHCPLLQSDCKNAFCQGVLPEDKITILRPPSGDPKAQPNEYWLLLSTFYGLRQSPRHWYDKITKIVVSIGLTSSLEDPCLITGFVCNPHQPDAPSLVHPLLLGLYVDDFVYFSKDPAVEALFCHLLGEHCKLILWPLWSGFSGFISHGASPHQLYLST